MKSPKYFLSLLLLLGHMSASAMAPCSGPCDTPRPDFKCRKKVNASSVDTDTLLVRKNANVCADLTVNGTINNLELQLMRDSGVPPTDEVYTQFFQYPFAQNILEVIYDFSVPRDLVVPGTEINPDAPIYGYNTETQELVLGGGPELSYNPDFESVEMRYHGQNPVDLFTMTQENMQSWYEHTLSYYIQRGFEMPGSDVYPQYEGQFIFSYKIDEFNELTPGNFVAIKFQYTDSPLPVALDLIATAAAFPVSPQVFEADPNLHLNGLYYPMRIPITTDFNEFNAQYNKESLAYYDNVHRRITIHVPDCNNAPTQLFEYKLSIPCCNCNLDVDVVDKLVSFNGTFNLMRRNQDNQLVSSTFNELEYLIQASEVVSIKSEATDHGISQIVTQDYLFNELGGVFTGLAIPLMNGAGPQTDVYVVNNGNSNAFSVAADPLIYPVLNEGMNFNQTGDNPVTTLIENYGSPTFNGYFDSVFFEFDFLGLPLPVMEGQTTPEENPSIPLPELVSPTILLNRLVGHEFLHSTQSMQGMQFFLPTEGQATGLEQDPKLNSSIYLGWRARDWGSYLPLAINGLFPLTLPEVAAQFGRGFTTYGSSIFWRYLATQFDYNYQVIRRMGDIMSHETFGPLMQENGIPFAYDAFALGGDIGFNPAGSLLALSQALIELHGKDIQDVFSDYAISLAMLRNNTSIPAQYRHEYPYWLASPTYAGYQDLSLAYPLYASWWQDYQDNIIVGTATVSTIPAISGTPFTAYYTANGPQLTSPILAQGEITDPTNACSEVQNDLTDKIGIVLADGSCNSSTFVLNTEDAGNPIAATLIIDVQDAGPSNYGGSPAQTQVAVVISQEDGELLLDALEVNPTLTIVLDPMPAPLVPVLREDVIDRQTEDMTMLIFEVPEDVNTVTADVTEGDWRISVLQFTSNGTPTGQFIIDGPHANTGGQTVLDITQFPRDPESGSVRLVCANVGIHDYQGLNNWCGAAPIYTGTISILRS